MSPAHTAVWGLGNLPVLPSATKPGALISCRGRPGSRSWSFLPQRLACLYGIRYMLHCVLGGMIPNSLSYAFRKTKPSNDQDMLAVLVEFLMCVLSFPLSLKEKGKRNGRSNIT